MVNIFLVSALIIFLYMNLVFILSLIKKNAAIVDVAWGLGFVLVVASHLARESLLHRVLDPRQLLVAALITIWGTRLSWHIYRRNRGKPEDYRYAIWRQKWGQTFVWRSYFQIFWLQGFFMFLVLMPSLLVLRSRAGRLNWLDALGLLVWLAGFFFEAVADAQLRKFKKIPENKGHIITTGLWKYSRHPNYFGESVMWWGIFLIALNAPGGWLGIIGPLTITLLLTLVSGIPLLEKKYRCQTEFEAYRAVTSAFFPLPPRKKARTQPEL
ncbi:MAG: DUF1295 domain-containing protein [Candidatus Saccharicenans sp.]|nr:DUF1295 domain-containing protein [Candidatus Saccharicenans sp.]MDH7492978.1 DUF1295 domain-containing protein [Candidatus Saccharicenans sp.]